MDLFCDLHGIAITEAGVMVVFRTVCVMRRGKRKPGTTAGEGGHFNLSRSDSLSFFSDSLRFNNALNS